MDSIEAKDILYYIIRILLTMLTLIELNLNKEWFFSMYKKMYKYTQNSKIMTNFVAYNWV